MKQAVAGLILWGVLMFVPPGQLKQYPIPELSQPVTIQQPSQSLCERCRQVQPQRTRLQRQWLRPDRPLPLLRR